MTTPAIFWGSTTKGDPIVQKNVSYVLRSNIRMFWGRQTVKAARAVIQYFEKWQPEKAAERDVLKEELEDIIEGANLIFSVEGRFVHEDSGGKTSVGTI